jgi:hypothetical protein
MYPRMRRVVLGFIAGFLATITFHQIALAAFHAAGFTPRGAWSMQPVPPFDVPAVISLAFWGGVWGIIMMVVIDRFRGAAYWVWAIVFGAVLPTLVAAFVVAPLKHQPIAGGGKLSALVTGLTINGAWGLGTAAFYRLFLRK